MVRRLEAHELRDFIDGRVLAGEQLLRLSHLGGGGAEIAAMLPEAAASNAVIVLYSHGIGETAEGVSMSRDDLETILSAAESLGMAILGFDELDKLDGK